MIYFRKYNYILIREILKAGQQITEQNKFVVQVIAES